VIRIAAARSASLTRVLVVRELRLRYRQSVLEMAWSLINPVGLLVAYGFVLTRVFDLQSPNVPYLSLVWTGMVVWMTFSSGVGAGVHAIVGNADLISKVYFPREVIPFAAVGASIFDLAIGVAVLIPVVLVQVGEVGWPWLAAVPVIAVLVVWTAAVATFVSVLAVFVRDMTHAVVLALQVRFFVTPVMYPADQLPPGLSWVKEVNPLAVCISSLRASVLERRWPHWSLLGIQAVAGTAALVLAVAYCRSTESRMVDVV
jgi:ABC-type polysaccharide/polyol phosphate export permease